METQLKKPSTNSVGNWTPDEDEAILRYVYEKGKGDAQWDTGSNKTQKQRHCGTGAEMSDNPEQGG